MQYRALANRVWAIGLQSFCTSYVSSYYIHICKVQRVSTETTIFLEGLTKILVSKTCSTATVVVRNGTLWQAHYYLSGQSLPFWNSKIALELSLYTLQFGHWERCQWIYYHKHYIKNPCQLCPCCRYFLTSFLLKTLTLWQWKRENLFKRVPDSSKKTNRTSNPS